MKYVSFISWTTENQSQMRDNFYKYLYINPKTLWTHIHLQRMPSTHQAGYISGIVTIECQNHPAFLP